MKGARRLSRLILPLVITGAFLGAGCENDLKDLQKISANEVNKPIERYKDVDIIYSDSAKVKAHMTAPLMINYKVEKPYTEMPNGVKVIFFDNNGIQNCTVVADYGLRREKEKLIELRKNVVGTNAKGDSFASDELIWDENTRQIHSTKLVHIRMADGSIADGTGFVSDENFNHWTLSNGKGDFPVSNQELSH